MTDSSIDAELNVVKAQRYARTGRRPQTSVLYDAPGPRSRRATRVATVLTVVAIIVGAWWFIYRPLADRGQFSMELWGPLIDWRHDDFEAVWRRIGVGLRATLTAAALAIVSSLICGLALGVLRVLLKQLITRRYTYLPGPVALGLRGLNRLGNAVTRICVEVFRGMPVLITIYFVARGLPELGMRIDNVMWYLVVGLTIYNSVVIAEILRSGMEGLPKGQREAAFSIGLSPGQTTLLVLLPQAVRIMLPAVISQLVVVLKDTSLGFIINYDELLNIGKKMGIFLDNPLQTYTIIALIYLAINYALSRLADWTQRRLARSRARETRDPGSDTPPSDPGPRAFGDRHSP